MEWLKKGLDSRIGTRKKTINILKGVNGTDVMNMLDAYDTEEVNRLPFTEKELHKMYVEYVDPIICCARELAQDNIFTLGNEVRAMIGHISDYRMNPTQKKNLEDAYGHFRRLNIDTFKIMCDEFDKVFLKYLQKHYHYDFREVHSTFLYEYSKMYFEAKNTYLKAQLGEHVGSDRLAGNVIQLYHSAARKYVELLVYFQEQHKGLEKGKWKFIISISISTVFAVIGLFL